MRIRSHHRRRVIDDLRLAIDCLPVRTREAMLQALADNDRIIVGAYVDGHGGVCPMLAAHRRGARTDFLSFAKSWDRFTKARRPGRPATKRELTILAGQLQASLLKEAGVDFSKVINDHQKLMASGAHARSGESEDRRLSGRIAPDEADPSGIIRVRRLRASWRARRPIGV